MQEPQRVSMYSPGPVSVVHGGPSHCEGTLGRGQVLLPLRSRRASGHVGGLLPEQVALANAKQEAQVAFHYGVLALASARVR